MFVFSVLNEIERTQMDINYNLIRYSPHNRGKLLILGNKNKIAKRQEFIIRIKALKKLKKVNLLIFNCFSFKARFANLKRKHSNGKSGKCF